MASLPLIDSPRSSPVSRARAWAGIARAVIGGHAARTQLQPRPTATCDPAEDTL